jgi:hypothetical protein
VSSQFFLQSFVERKKKKLIFCGHSLGGAISHLVTLRILKKHPGKLLFYWRESIPIQFIFQKKKDLKEKIFSVGFGAPFFGDSKLAECVSESQLKKNFLTIICGKDPVPSVLNLGAVAQNMSNNKSIEIGVKKLEKFFFLINLFLLEKTICNSCNINSILYTCQNGREHSFLF